MGSSPNAAGQGGADFAASVTGFHNLNVLAPPEKKKGSKALVLLTTLAVGAVSAIALSQLAVSHWLDSTQIFMWAIPAMIPTLALGIAGAAWARGSLDAVSAVAGLLMGALAASGSIAVAVGWTRPQVRASILDSALTDSEVARKVLEDPSDNVAIAACRILSERHESADWRHLLLSSLTLRPSVVGPCLAQVGPEAQQSLVQSLADRWTRELQSNSPDGDRACAVANSLSTLPINRGQLDTRLMYCMLSSENPAAAQCCGDVLAATLAAPEQWAARLKETIGLVRDEETTVGVYSMAFHQQGLSEPQQRFADQVKFQDPAVQRVALEFACDSIIHGQTAAIPHLIASLDGTCEVDVTRVVQGRQTWFGICTDAVALVESSEASPSESVCTAAVELLSQAAMATAQSLVSASIRTPEGGLAARSIDEGWGIVNADIPVTNEELRGLVPPGVSEEQAQRIMEAYSLSPIEWGGNPLLMAPAAQ